jgi:hypothetical protein
VPGQIVGGTSADAVVVPTAGRGGALDQEPAVPVADVVEFGSVASPVGDLACPLEPEGRWELAENGRVGARSDCTGSPEVRSTTKMSVTTNSSVSRVRAFFGARSAPCHPLRGDARPGRVRSPAREHNGSGPATTFVGHRQRRRPAPGVIGGRRLRGGGTAGSAGPREGVRSPFVQRRGVGGL